MHLDPKSAAAASLNKLMGIGLSLLGKHFRSSKCKTEVKLATARIKLLRNKREAQIRLMRRDVALLLQSGQDSTARIRVEHVMREQNTMAANEIIELFCELVVAQLSIISKQRDCPADLKEGISSLIFAAPRCSEIPELLRIRDMFEKKYGKDFVSAATDLRPNSGVNRTLIEKLSVRTPPGEVKLKIMKEIAKEYQVEWDTAETEQELLKPPEERLNGPSSFTSASSLPVKSTVPLPDESLKGHEWRSFNDGEDGNIHFTNTASSAQAAAELAEKAAVELAEKAAAMAQAAANLAKQVPYQADQNASYNTKITDHERSSSNRVTSRRSSLNSVNPTRFFTSTDHPDMSRPPRRNSYPQSFSVAPCDEDARPAHVDRRKVQRRKDSYNVRSVHSDIKFDDTDGLESDCDDNSEENTDQEEESHPPPNRPPPALSPSDFSDLDERRFTDNTDTYKSNLSHVHRKLPDYESLAARFEALKLRRFS